MEIVPALYSEGLGFGLSQGRKQKSGKNSDDRDRDQKFDQRERVNTCPFCILPGGFRSGKLGAFDSCGPNGSYSPVPRNMETRWR